MKKFLILFMAFSLPLFASAQESNDGNAKDHAVYLELGGGSTEVGVNYDQRFSKDTRWGFRAGLSFAYSGSESFFSGSSSTRGYAVPIAVNYLIGNKKNSLELGVGASLGIYNLHYDEYYVKAVDEATFKDYSVNPNNYPNVAGYVDNGGQSNYYDLIMMNHRSENKFGYYLFADIGYRHVANSGFFFRAGLSPAWNSGKEHSVFRGFGHDHDHFSVMPYLGFGWAF